MYTYIHGKYVTFLITRAAIFEWDTSWKCWEFSNVMVSIVNFSSWRHYPVPKNKRLAQEEIKANTLIVNQIKSNQIKLN